MMRGTSRVFGRDTKTALPLAVGGEGVWLWDSEGRRYLDGSGGASVSCLGHGHPDVRAAIHAQVDQVAYAHTGYFSSPAQEELAEVMTSDAPEGMGHAFFVTGGSEAVEAALKLARQYQVERGEAGRWRTISRRFSYHGNTLGALAASGYAGRRAPYLPMLMDVAHIDPCHVYRGRRADETDEAYGLRVADQLEAKILELGPGSVASFIAEPVVGATLGAAPAVGGYFRRIREICDRYGVVLIFDEVMCGVGRTGSLHACQQEGVVPDLMTMAKGLGGGYQPIGAVLVHDRIYRAIAEGSGAFVHGHTYMGHPVACAAALAVQKVIRRENLVENVRLRGTTLNQALHARFGQHAHVGDIRGRGLMQAIELVADRGTKAPFEAKQKLSLRIKEAAMERGLICYPTAGAADGVAGDHVLLAPPYIATDADIEEIVGRLGEAVDAAVAGL